jgi:thiamine-phosphate pyrophosphorylase
VGLPPLILMTDDARLPDPLAAARALPRGSMVIVRARDASRREALLAALKPVARGRKLVLVVADDPALAAQADGLHLPQTKAKQAAHWRALHPDWIVTAAAHALSVALGVCRADAILLSPIFATQSHPGVAHFGAARGRLIAKALRTPVYALGGIDARNTRSLRGFKGIAAIGALR